MKNVKHFDIRITGKVQGVFFRITAQKVAEGTGLTGVVRNNPDGSVSIEVEGDPEALREFVDWCHDGPEKAKVDRVDIEERGMQHYDDFRIVE